MGSYIPVLGRVLQHIASDCLVIAITHCRDMGTYIGVEFKDPETGKRMAGLISVRPTQQQDVAITVGTQVFSVKSAEETDYLSAFRDSVSFLECFSLAT